MTGQVEIAVTALGLRDAEAQDAAVGRAADAIYAAFPQGGPCVAGDADAGTLSVLLAVDEDGPQSWMPQLELLCAVVHGPIERVSVGPFREPVVA